MTITNRIRFWRQQRGWSLQQLAAAAGTTRAQIDKLERGSRRLTVDWLVRLAAPLGCDPRSLMALENNSNSFSEAAQTPLQQNLPLHHLQSAGQRRGYRMAPHPTGTVPCPYFLSSLAQAYAVELQRVQTAALELPGQLIFINPVAKPQTGALLLAQTDDGLWHLGQCQKLSLTSVILRSPPRGRTTLPRKQLRTLHGVAAIVNLPLAKPATAAKPRHGTRRDPA